MEIQFYNKETNQILEFQTGFLVSAQGVVYTYCPSWDNGVLLEERPNIGCRVKHIDLKTNDLEAIADYFRGSGFETDNIVDNEYYYKMASAVLSGLGISCEWVED